jgi:hypothetical protein
MTMNKRFYLDLLERSGWTFVQAAAAVAITAGGFGAEVWKAAAVAGGLAICKALVASQIGKPNTAALPDPPTR